MSPEEQAPEDAPFQYRRRVASRQVQGTVVESYASIRRNVTEPLPSLPHENVEVKRPSDAPARQPGPPDEQRNGDARRGAIPPTISARVQLKRTLLTDV